MPTLIQLGIEIDPTKTQTGKAGVVAAIGEIKQAAQQAQTAVTGIGEAAGKATQTSAQDFERAAQKLESTAARIRSQLESIKNAARPTFGGGSGPAPSAYTPISNRYSSIATSDPYGLYAGQQAARPYVAPPPRPTYVPGPLLPPLPPAQPSYQGPVATSAPYPQLTAQVKQLAEAESAAAVQAKAMLETISNSGNRAITTFDRISQSARGSSQLLYGLASFAGPFEGSVLRIANGALAAEAAFDRFNNSARSRKSRMLELQQALDAFKDKETAAKAASLAYATAQEAVATATKSGAATQAEMTAINEAATARASELAVANTALATSEAELEAATAAAAAGMTGLLATILPLLAVLAAVSVAIGAIVFAFKTLKDAVKLGNEFIQLRDQLALVTGSTKTATAELNHLREFRFGTQFQLPELVQATTRLHAMGYEGQQLNKILGELGNAAAVVGDKGLDQLAQTLQEVQRQGFVSFDQIDQLASRGLNLLPELEQVSGRSGQAILLAFNNGRISAAQFTQAMDLALSANGRFGSALDQQRGQLGHTIDNLKEKWGEWKTDLGIEIAPAVDRAFKQLSSLLTNTGASVNASNLGKSIADEIDAGIKASQNGKFGDWLIGEFAKALTYFGTALKIAFEKSEPDWLKSVLGHTATPGATASGNSLFNATSAIATPLVKWTNQFLAWGDRTADKLKDGIVEGWEKLELRLATAKFAGAFNPANVAALGPLAALGSGFADYSGYAVSRTGKLAANAPLPIDAGGTGPSDQSIFTSVGGAATAGNLALGPIGALGIGTMAAVVQAQDQLAKAVEQNTQTTQQNTKSLDQPSALYGAKQVPATSDQVSIDQAGQAFKVLNDQVGAGTLSMDAFNQQVSELKAKTINGLIDPSKAAEWGEKFAFSLDDAQSKAQLATRAIELYFAQMERNVADNSASAVDSFTFGIEKAAHAWGTFDQQLSKLGSDATNTLADGFSTALGDIATGAKSAGQAFKDFAVSVLADIGRMLIKLAILQIAQQAVGFFFGGGEAPSAPAGFGHGGMIVGGTPSFTRMIDPMVFMGAQRFHRGGLVGGEVPIIAKRGEGVFTQEQMSRLSPAGAGSQHNEFNVEITVHPNGNTDQNDHSVNSDQQSAESARLLQAKMREFLVRETHPGGVIDQWGRHSPVTNRSY